MDQQTFGDYVDVLRELLDRLHRSPHWEPNHDTVDIEEHLSNISSGTQNHTELSYTRRGTGARISVSFPASAPGDAVKILLDNPLDPQLQYSEDGFVGRIGETHRAIVRRHSTRYIEPVADPSLLARVAIPVQCDEEALARLVERMDAIALASDEFHAELETVVETFGDL